MSRHSTNFGRSLRWGIVQLGTHYARLLTMDCPRPAIPLERMTSEAMFSCVHPFAECSDAVRSELARVAIRHRRPQGFLVTAMGRPVEGLDIVLRGRVSLSKEGKAGRDLIVGSLGPGEAFGEESILPDARASTNAVAATAVDLAHIPAQCLRDLACNDATLSMQLMAGVHAKLEDTRSIAAGLALCDVEERLRRLLVRLARRQGRGTNEHDWILAPMPTQSELARMVGSCRETVSRTLSAMARHGYLSTRGRRMILHASLMAGSAA